MRSNTIALALLSITIFPGSAQLPEDLKRNFDEAEQRIVRRSPTVFPGLPASVVRELQRRGCTIPQNFAPQPNNVIKGEFAKPGETDWAMLCSVKGVSTILVFRNGSEKRPAELATFEDRIFLRGISPDKIVYSRGITPVGQEFIMRHYDAYGGEKPPPIDHEGINDGVSNGSVVWYFYSGKWLKLTGAD